MPESGCWQAVRRVDCDGVAAERGTGVREMEAFEKGTALLLEWLYGDERGT
jgi:hypothetical protein